MRAIAKTLLATLFVALLSCFVGPAWSLGIVAFDYGTDSLKTALVKPGMAPDVVLTRDSKRKLPAVVAFKMEDRLFGTDAMNIATRYPGDTFPDLKSLLGRQPSRDESVAAQYASILGSNLTSHERNTFAITRATDYTLDKHGPDTHTIEELVGMQLAHAKMLAEETADEKVKLTYPGNIGTFGGLDTVITVPTFYTALERQALYDAAVLAGFRPRVISDAAAAATSLALKQTFTSTPEIHLLYDAGHGSTRASLVRFSTKSFPTEDLFGTTMKEHTFVEVLATGWSREAGGLALDEIVRNLLVEKFKQSNKAVDITANPRAMARLLLASSKAKHVLSANQEARVSIEGLIDDIDFRTVITREDFEAAAAPLQKGFSQPILDALKRGDTKLSAVASVILLGGTSRVPLVQRAVEQQAGVPNSLLAQNLNADEAMALGAGFYGASYNPQLKMKPLKVVDVQPYPLVLVDNESKVETLFQGSVDEEPILKQYEGQTTDFSFEAGYAKEADLEKAFERPLYRFEVTDIADTLRSLKASGDLAKVDATVNMTLISRPLGSISVESAWLTVKPKKEGVVGALRSFFGGAAAKVEDVTTADDSNSTVASDSNSTNTTAEALDVVKDKVVRLTVNTVALGTLQPLTSAATTASKEKLYLMDAAARRKLLREEHRNKLESYVYRMREIVHDSSFEGASSKKERQDIESSASEMTSWMNSAEGDRASYEELKKKLSGLEALVKPIESRMTEAKGRTGAEKRLQRAFEITEAFLTEANANLTAAIESQSSSRYSRVELDSLSSQLSTDKSWFEKANSEQIEKKSDEEPAWKVEDAEKKRKKLIDKVEKMKKRRIPKTRPSASGKKETKKEEAKKEEPKHEEL